MPDSIENLITAFSDFSDKLAPQELESVLQEFFGQVKTALINEPEFLKNLLTRENFLQWMLFDFVNTKWLEHEQHENTPSPSTIKQRNRGMVTISSVIEGLQKSDSSLPEEQRKLKRSTATLKRRVDALLTNLGIAKRFAKDGNGQYAIPVEWRFVAEIFVIELSDDHSFLNKVLDSRYDEMTLLEAVEFYKHVSGYTKGKMDTEQRQLCLDKLDEALKYRLLVHICNIQHAFQVAITALSELPYQFQVDLTASFFKDAMKPWSQGISQIAKDHLTLDDIIQIVTEHSK